MSSNATEKLKALPLPCVGQDLSWDPEEPAWLQPQSIHDKVMVPYQTGRKVTSIVPQAFNQPLWLSFPFTLQRLSHSLYFQSRAFISERMHRNKEGPAGRHHPGPDQRCHEDPGGYRQASMVGTDGTLVLTGDVAAEARQFPSSLA